MMPDLGKYAWEVGLAYGVSLSALAMIALVYAVRSRRVKQSLVQAESRRNA